MKVMGSVGLKSPTRNIDSGLVTSHAVPRPIAQPRHVMTIASFIISVMTARRVAPSATRMPISPERRLTE